jgi:DNA anti-recombination protein RmuC
VSPSPDMPDLIDRLVAAAVECRELLADVRTATKDLRAAVKEVREERERLAAAVRDAVGAEIDEQVRVQLEALGELTRKQMDASVDKVSREFDKLANILMTGHDKGRPDDGFNLADLAEAERLRRIARGEL